MKEKFIENILNILLKPSKNKVKRISSFILTAFFIGVYCADYYRSEIKPYFVERKSKDTMMLYIAKNMVSKNDISKLKYEFKTSIDSLKNSNQNEHNIIMQENAVIKKEINNTKEATRMILEVVPLKLKDQIRALYKLQEIGMIERCDSINY